MSSIPRSPGSDAYHSLIAKTALNIRDIRVRAALPPLPRPLSTASGKLTHAAVVLVDISLTGGLEGRTYLFCPRPDMVKAQIAVIEALAGLVRGQSCDPVAIGAFLDRQFLLFGSSGLVTMGRAAIDMALWDALARAQSVPLFRLLGAQETSVRAYDSSGLGISNLNDVVEEAHSFTARGFNHIKLRLGYPSVEDDLRIVDGLRAAVGPEIGIMVDYNQSLTLEDAKFRCAALDDRGLVWIEEPIHAADFEGAALLEATTRTPIQIGENFQSPRDAARALSITSSRYQMPDVMKIGGITDWLRVSDLTQAAHVPISTHLFPEVSAHLLASAPHGHFLEYMNWTDAILEQPLEPEGGLIELSETPGTGLDWDERAVSRYQITP